MQGRMKLETPFCSGFASSQSSRSTERGRNQLLTRLEDSFLNAVIVIVDSRLPRRRDVNLEFFCGKSATSKSRFGCHVAQILDRCVRSLREIWTSKKESISPRLMLICTTRTTRTTRTLLNTTLEDSLPVISRHMPTTRTIANPPPKW